MRTTPLPNIPPQRYFSMAEVCYFSGIEPEQLTEWQRQEGKLIRKGSRVFSRLDLIRLRQLHHGISNYAAPLTFDSNGEPAIGFDELRAQLNAILVNISEELAK